MPRTKKPGTHKTKRIYTDLGEELQVLRLRANLTQRAVSDKLGYSSAQFISNFERGLAAPPLKKLSTLIKIYNAPTNKIMDLYIKGRTTRLEKGLL